MGRLLLVCGSLRAGSTNAAALTTARSLAPEGLEAELYEGLADLPHFNPDEDPIGGGPPAPAAALRRAIGEADGILFCAPEYAGALPGSFKNLLDWSVGGGEMEAKPVAWINVSGRAAPSGGAKAEAELREVLGYTNSTVVEAACVRVPVERGAIGADGLVGDGEARKLIAAAIAALAAAT